MKKKKKNSYILNVLSELFITKNKKIFLDIDQNINGTGNNELIISIIYLMNYFFINSRLILLIHSH